MQPLHSPVWSFIRAQDEARREDYGLAVDEDFDFTWVPKGVSLREDNPMRFGLPSCFPIPLTRTLWAIRIHFPETN